MVIVDFSTKHLADLVTVFKGMIMGLSNVCTHKLGDLWSYGRNSLTRTDNAAVKLSFPVQKTNVRIMLWHAVAAATCISISYRTSV